MASNPETKSGAVHTEHSSDNGKTWEDKGTSWTENPPTQIEVDEPETDAGLAEEAEVNENDDDGYQAAYGDYAGTGPEPPAQSGGTTFTESDEAHDYRYDPAETSGPRLTEEGSTLSDSNGYADRPGGPTDFGNANDPNANVEQPEFDWSVIAAHIKPDPTVTDPANPGEDDSVSAVTEGNIRLDMAGTLRDGVGPLDPYSDGAPAANRPKSGDAERTTSRDDDRMP